MTARLSTLLNAGPPAGAPGGGASADWDAMVDEDGRSPLAVLDIDQDGRLDLLYARDGGEGYTLAETRLNRETGQEETVVHVLTRFGTGDADGSGPDDFVLEHEDGRVEVILRGDESETGSWRASAPDAASAQTLVNVVGGAVEDMADLPEGIESRSDYAQGLADGLGGLLDDLDAQTRADAKVSTLDVDGRGLVDLVIETAEGPDFLRELGLAGAAPRDGWAP